ncbi:ead/Ea22-like family protein [Escherichia coli]|nr:ead/Ea22-like family protein [Escherichia coli]ELM8827304.1 ead/Ea22-like family protein [Escherichia coli]
MSKIDYQALRELAKQATQGEWVAFISPGKYGTYAVHTPGDNHHGDIVDWPGFDEQKNAENNARYIAAFNPEVVQALLDERERNQQYIKSRDQENEEIALTVGKLRVELEAAENNLIDSECHVAELEEALRDKQALLEASEKRIAELEAELVSQTYKLNELSGNSPVTPDGWISCSDRMPEDTKMLLAFSQGQIVAAYWNWVMSPIDYKKYRAFTYLSGNILDDVTHWMPLPEPPEQDGE